MKRRILTLLLTLVMVLSLLPGTALAVNDSSAPAVTYADLADINGTALVPDGAGENTVMPVHSSSACTAAVDGHDRAAARLVPG